MQAVIYTRVSLNRNGGRSVEDQERECRAECRRRGWKVRAVYTDTGISASRYGKHRPEWERCKDDLRSDDVLVVWEASRAQRDLEEFVRLRNVCAEKKVLLSYSGRVLDFTNGDDRFTGGLDALMAEHESERLRERVLRGKRSAAAAGRPTGKVPWGYRSAGVGKWEIDPIEAPKIREAVHRILRGESHHAVWEWLTTLDGYKPPTLSVMNRALRSPTLAGKRIHQGKVLGEGNWEPIITEEEHEQLRAKHDQIRAAYGRIESPGPKPRRLLSGIAVCGVCKETLTWRKNRHGNGIYVCRKGHVSRMSDTVDKLVTDKLFEILAEVNPNHYEDDDPGVAATWKEIQDLEKRRNEWQQLALAGEISPKSFAVFEQDLDQRLKALEAEIAAVAELGDVNWEDLHLNWVDMPIADRRRIVRAFFSVVVEPSARGCKVGGAGILVTPLEQRTN